MIPGCSASVSAGFEDHLDVAVIAAVELDLLQASEDPGAIGGEPHRFDDEGPALQIEDRADPQIAFEGGLIDGEGCAGVGSVAAVCCSTTGVGCGSAAWVCVSADAVVALGSTDMSEGGDGGSDGGPTGLSSMLEH